MPGSTGAEGGVGIALSLAGCSSRVSLVPVWGGTCSLAPNRAKPTMMISAISGLAIAQ